MLRMLVPQEVAGMGMPGAVALAGASFSWSPGGICQGWQAGALQAQPGAQPKVKACLGLAQLSKAKHSGFAFPNVPWCFGASPGWLHAPTAHAPVPALGPHSLLTADFFVLCLPLSFPVPGRAGCSNCPSQGFWAHRTSPSCLSPGQGTELVFPKELKHSST